MAGIPKGYMISHCYPRKHRQGWACNLVKKTRTKRGFRCGSKSCKL